MEKPQFETSVTILEKINQKLAELGSTMKYKKAPEFKDAYQSLKGKKIMMIDDLQNLLEAFAADLVVATDGNASFIKFTPEDKDNIIKKILQDNPDIILLDFNLTENFKGSHLAQILKSKNFRGYLVGFSSEKTAISDFKKAGVETCIEKITDLPERSVQELGMVYKKKTLKS